MQSFTFPVFKLRAKIRCKYPLHGKGNIMCLHEGVIEKRGYGDNGPWVVVNEGEGKARRLLQSKMTELELS